MIQIFSLRILFIALLLMGMSNESNATPFQENTSNRQVQAFPSAQDEMDMSNITAEKAIRSLPEPIHLSDIKVWESLSEHVHNKWVHFPVALGLLACVLWLISFKQGEYQISAKLVLVLSAITGLLALITGENQKQVFQDTPLIEIMQWHEKAGFFCLFLFLAGAVLQWFQRFRQFIWVYIVLMVLTILLTGFLGGLLSHAHLEPTHINPIQQHSDP